MCQKSSPAVAPVSLRLRQIGAFPDLGSALGRLRAFTAALNAAGVTQLEYHAMLLMKTRPGERATVGDLARQLKLTRSFSARLADRLVENEFALRRLGQRPPDTVVQLSPRGDEILAGLAVRHLEGLHAMEQLLAGAASTSRHH